MRARTNALLDVIPPRPPLQFKKRVRVALDAPVAAPLRLRVPLAAPVAVYWTASAAFIYGLASGALPVQAWLETRSSWVAPTEPFEWREEPPESRASFAPPATPSPAPVAFRGDVTLEPVTATADALSRDALPREEPADVVVSAAPAPSVAAASTANARSEPPPSSHALRPAGNAPAAPRETPDPPPAAHALAPAAPRETPRAPLPRDPAPVAVVAPRQPAPPAERGTPPVSTSFTGCEAALAAAESEVDLTRARRSTPDLPREAFARVLDDGRYLAPCAVPDSTSIDICAAVQGGRAVGITVTTSPRNARAAACVARAVSRLSFPVHPKVDIARTHFAPTP